MPTQGIIVDAVNFEELRQAMTEAPVETYRYVKVPLFRFARRVAKRVKVDSLSGRPGIAGGPWRRIKDKNMQGFSTGNDLSTVRAVNKASRILRTHIEGAVITPTHGKALTLRGKGIAGGRGAIFAKVRSVTIPARVKFEQPWKDEIPKASGQIADAMQRAMQAAVDRNMKTITSAVQFVTGSSHG